MNRLILTALALACGVSVALAAGTAFPAITCAAARAKVAEVGEARAIAFALENGATWKQINAARKCLKQ